MININLLFVFSFLTRLVFGSESQKPPSDRDILLQGGTIITFNKENSALEPLVGSILISNGTIKEIGQKIDVADDVEIIDATGTIVSPGFVDTHRHGWQTMYRTMGGNITLPAYYYSFGEFGAGAAIFEPEDVYISQLMGVYEAMSAGVTSIVDHAHHTWSKETAEAGLKASIDSGNRVWWCYTVHPVVNHTSPYNLDFSATTWQLDQIDEISRRGKLGDGRVTLGLAYDGLQGTKESVMEVFKFVTDRNVTPITTHYVGGAFQVGLEAIELLNEYGLLNISTPLIFSHASGITDNEIDLLRSSNQYISTTSESELHYGHGHPKSYEIMDQAALGIDTHFTFSSDIITQMRIHLQTTRLTLYNPVIGNDFLPSNTGMTVDQAFLMGTRNGGLALNRTDIGVIQVGAKADIVVFDTSSLGLLGWTDPVAAIVLHSNVGDIRDVIVDGKIKKRNKKLIGIDMPSLREEFLKRGQSVRAEFLRQNWTDFKVGLETELTGWTNDSFREVEIADVVRGNGTGFFGQGL